MKQSPNTSWAIISAAIIGLIGTLVAEYIKARSSSPGETARHTPPPAASEHGLNLAASLSASSPKEMIPDLEDIWHVESYQTYQGKPLNIRFRMSLTQKGNQVEIIGVKTEEMFGGEYKRYTVSEQKPIHLIGSLALNHSGVWEITMTGFEGSQSKGQLPVEAHVILSDKYSQGYFSSPGATHSAGAVWIPESEKAKGGWLADGRVLFGS